MNQSTFRADAFRRDLEALCRDHRIALFPQHHPVALWMDGKRWGTIDSDEAGHAGMEFVTREGEAEAALPKVIVTLNRGVPTVYSTDKALDVEIVDLDTNDEQEHDAARHREDEITVLRQAGTLFEVA